MINMRRISSLFIIIIISIVFLSGCWDKIEINDRAFVIGMGIDVKSDKDEFLLSLALPNLPVITGQSSGGEPAYVKEVSDQSILGSFKEMSTRVNKEINVENLEVVIFGLDLISDATKVKEVLDHFERNPSYSRNLPVLVSRNTAIDILKIKPEGAEVVGNYIGGIYKNNSQYVSFFNKMFLGDMLKDALEHNGTFIIPEVIGEDNEVMLGGAAVLKEFQFEGWLNESEVRSIAWVREGTKDTQVNFEFMDTAIPFVFTNSEQKIYFDLKDNHLFVTIDIFTEGEVTEFIFNQEDLLTSEEYITLMENTLSLELVNEIDAVTKRMQNELKADLFRLNDTLKIKDKDLYLQTEEHWDEYFSACDIDVNVEVKVRRFGEIK